MYWKVAGWELPSSVNCVIRERNLETGKVTEYVYKNTASAKKKLTKLMEGGKSEFSIADHDEVHFLTPNIPEDYDYDDEDYG